MIYFAFMAGKSFSFKLPNDTCAFGIGKQLHQIACRRREARKSA